MKSYLLIRHMKVHNANAMSSTLTIGIPAMTAWMGFTHALERFIRQQDNWQDVRFNGVGISFHQCHLEVYRGPGDKWNSIIGTANPLRKKGAGFERPPFIEEPRIQMNVSLLVEVSGLDGDSDNRLIDQVQQRLPAMKLAGGDIMDVGLVKMVYMDPDEPNSEMKILSALMPGYVIIERDDLVCQEMEEGKDSLDGLLEYLEIKKTAEKDEEGNITGWTYEKKGNGWLVPISVGFKGISKLGKVKNQRDSNVPHRFAENVVTLGEFRMPYRFDHIDDIMWHYEFDENKALYLCSNHG